MAEEGSGGGAPTGIELAVTFDATDTLEVYRDTAVGFGTQVLIVELTGGDQLWVDPLPLNNTYYYYRVRAKRSGYATTSYANLGAPTGYKPTTLLA